jgi:hypothetical protein
MTDAKVPDQREGNPGAPVPRCSAQWATNGDRARALRQGRGAAGWLKGGGMGGGLAAGGAAERGVSGAVSVAGAAGADLVRPGSRHALRRGAVPRSRGRTGAGLRVLPPGAAAPGGPGAGSSAVSAAAVLSAAGAAAGAAAGVSAAARSHRVPRGAVRAARLLAAGRIAVGVAQAVVPQAAERWLPARPAGAKDPAAVTARGLGVRDTVVAAGCLHALSQGRGAAEWAWLQVAADVADGAGTAGRWRALDRREKTWIVLLGLLAAADTAVAVALGGAEDTAE